MDILFCTSEAYPLIKTGGLADVAGSLPRALHLLQHDVRLVLPAYQSVMQALQGRPQLKAEPGIERMRAYRLETHREEEVRWCQAPVFAVDVIAVLGVAERLDRLDAALGQVSCHALDQHPAQPAPRERGHHPGRGQ